MNISILELNSLEIDDNEIEVFLKKFTNSNLEMLDLILYFSSFNSEIEELVNRVKKIRKKIQVENSIKNSNVRIFQRFSQLNIKELNLIIGLLDEAEFCASSDSRYSSEANYLNYRKKKEKKELEKKHNKQKILTN